MSNEILSDSGLDNGDARRKLNWLAAILSGAVSGLLLLIVPRGIPWSAAPTFVSAMMGRSPAEQGDGQMLSTVGTHFALALLYGLLIAMAIRNSKWLQGILMGAAIGLMLYLVNLAVVTFWMPAWPGGESRVVLCHIVFGIMSAAMYKGMTARAA